MAWDEYQKEFEPDGAPREIYVKNVDLNHWQSFIDFLRRTAASLNYSVEGTPAELPTSIAEVILDQEHSHRLAIHLNGVTVNCHFFTPEKIKLDFDPREIDSEAKAKVIFRFMSTVGRTLNRQVILTLENAETQPIFRYEPGAGIEYLALNKGV